MWDAIRGRHVAGESMRAIAEDHDLPLRVVRVVCSWKMVK
jgi:hypothetical protein